MKKLFFLMLLLILGATFIMCSGEQKSEANVEEETQEAASEVVADTSMATCDGGCGMEVEKSKMIAYKMDGETLYFCSEMCKENYLASKKEEKKNLK
jgi:YHS domain-containing protein